MVKLRLAFFGTPEFAATALRRLLNSAHTVVAVVTQPDRPRGRGQRVSFSPVKSVALEANLPVLQPERLKDPGFQEVLTRLDPDLGVVAAYGKILPETVIGLCRQGLINIHASILPKFRGAAPVHRAVIAGESETGVSIMRVVRELDAGGVFAVARRAIGADETSLDIEHALASLGAQLCAEVIDQIALGTAREVPQEPESATYANRLTKEEGQIDWSRAAAQIHNLVRGLHPWPHAQASIAGQRVLILKASPIVSSAAHGAPGEILSASGDELIVATGDGALRILQLQPEGRRAMTAREFLAGRRLVPGQRFDGPKEPGS